MLIELIWVNWQKKTMKLGSFICYIECRHVILLSYYVKQLYKACVLIRLMFVSYLRTFWKNLEIYDAIRVRDHLNSRFKDLSDFQPISVLSVRLSMRSLQ
jgi:hypothetical protein